MFRKSLAVIAVIGTTVATMTCAQAHDGATGVVKERMDLMKIIGKNTKMIAPIATGSADMNLKAVEEGAAAIAAAAKEVGAKFTEGSLSEASEAKANIWTDWAKFSGLLGNLAADATKLGELAKAGEEFELMDAFGKMTKNCKSCHTEFRQKKD